MTGRGEMFRIGDHIDMKLRRQRAGVVAARVADVRNLQLDHGLILPERRRIQNVVRPSDWRLTQRQVETERERFQFGGQPAAPKFVAFHRRKVEYSQMSRLPHEPKVTRSQAPVNQIHATGQQAKRFQSHDNYRNVNDIAPTMRDSTNRIQKPLPVDITSVSNPQSTWAKFFAEFAKECFIPSESVPKKREIVENHEINVEAPREVVASLFNGDIQNNSDDVDEEKEILGSEAQSKLRNRENPEAVDVHSKQYPKENLVTHNIDEVGLRSMNINIKYLS